MIDITQYVWLAGLLSVVIAGAVNDLREINMRATKQSNEMNRLRNIQAKERADFNAWKQSNA